MTSAVESLSARYDRAAKVWPLTKHCNSTCVRAVGPIPAFLYWYSSRFQSKKRCSNPVYGDDKETKDSTCTAQPARRRGNWPRARFCFERICAFPAFLDFGHWSALAADRRVWQRRIDFRTQNPRPATAMIHCEWRNLIDGYK